MNTRRGQVKPRIGQLKVGRVVGLQQIVECSKVWMAILILLKEVEELR